MKTTPTKQVLTKLALALLVSVSSLGQDSPQNPKLSIDSRMAKARSAKAEKKAMAPAGVGQPLKTATMASGPSTPKVVKGPHGETVHTGENGGKYYINKNGNRTYLSSNQ